MGWIITLIVGAIIGAIAGSITGKDFPAGMFGNIIAGLLGAWLGGKLFEMGSITRWYSYYTSFIRIGVLVLIVSFVVKAARK